MPGKWLSVLLVFFYVAFFAISIGPLGWLIISEVFPQKLRGLGSSIGSLSVWFFNSIVSFTFFKIVHAFTISGTEIYAEGENLGNPAGAFWFYAVVALAALIWGYFYVPETKGVSLEKIEEYWLQGGQTTFLEIGKKCPGILESYQYSVNNKTIMVKYHNYQLKWWKEGITLLRTFTFVI